MSHRKRDKNGKVLPKVRARARTKIRWAKRHIKIKSLGIPENESLKNYNKEMDMITDSTLDKNSFSSMKKVDL